MIRTSLTFTCQSIFFIITLVLGAGAALIYTDAYLLVMPGCILLSRGIGIYFVRANTSQPRDVSRLLEKIVNDDFSQTLDKTVRRMNPKEEVLWQEKSNR